MDEITLWRRYEVEAAHQLTAGVPEGHRCRRLHGHRYVIHVGIHGSVREDTGMLLEYADLDTEVQNVLRHIDHHSLNTLHDRHSTDLAAVVSSNPTVELLCVWLVHELKFLDGRVRLVGVRVEEDSRASVEWAEPAR